MMGLDMVARAALAGVLNSLWIAVLLAAVVWTLARTVPRTNAATRHLIWWTMLALVLILPFGRWDRGTRSITPPVTPSAVPVVATAATPDSPIPARTPEQAMLPLQVPAGDWLRAAMAFWLLFALLQLCRVAWSFGHLRKLKRESQAAPDAIADRFRYWVAECGIRRPVRLLISERIASPLATGFLHPAVILPAPLLAQFGDSDLDHVLLHELAHVARGDDWTNLMARCLDAFTGLHPVAAWTLRQIARERELACDDWVVSRIGAARPYAASLARLFEVCRRQRRIILATGMAGSASHLGERIETLLASGRQFTPRASRLRVGLAAMALLALVTAGGRAPRWIVLAQSSSSQSHEVPRTAAVVNPAVVNPHGSFLAALVAAGYGDLSVDEIIALKDHGIDARFLADVSQSGWERLKPEDMIALHDHGVPAEMLRALRDAGFAHIEIRSAIEAYEQGVRPGTLKEAAQHGSHLTLAQVVKLKQAGVIQ
jgi:beta-lactamase regulating signal transducer with metallopeptidase domain